MSFCIPLCIGNKSPENNLRPWLSVGAPPSNLVPLTFNQAMAFLWRVKTWTLTATGSFINSTTGGTITFACSATLEYTDFTRSFIDITEQHLIRTAYNLAVPADNPFYRLGSVGIEGKNISGTINAAPAHSPSTGINPDPLYFLDGNYYFAGAMEFVFASSNDITGGHASVGVCGQMDPFDPIWYNKATNIPMTIDPIIAPSFSTPSKCVGTVLLSVVPTVCNVAIHLTAVEFFPYTTRLGTPVYDIATGAQLNDPFS